MYQRILVPVDGSLTSERALDEALKFAQPQHSQLELIRVVEDVGYVDDENYINYVELRESMRLSGEEILAQAQHKLSKAGLRVHCTLVEAHGSELLM